MVTTPGGAVYKTFSNSPMSKLPTIKYFPGSEKAKQVESSTLKRFEKKVIIRRRENEKLRLKKNETGKENGKKLCFTRYKPS